MELQDGEDFPKGNTKHNESDVLLYNKLTSELPDLKIAPVNNADEIDDNNFNFLQYKKAKSNFADMPDVALPTDITPAHMAVVAKAAGISYFNNLVDNVKDDKDVKKRGFKKLTYTDNINPNDESYLEQKNADIIREKATKLGKSVGIDYMEAIPTASTTQKNPLAYTNYGQLNQINDRLNENANNKNLAIVNSRIKKINASLPKEEMMQELTSFKEYESQEPIIKEKAKRADLLNTKKSNDIFLKGVNEEAEKSGIRQFVDIADYNKNYEPETLKKINKDAETNGTPQYKSLAEYNKSVSTKIAPKKIIYSKEEQKKQIVKAGKASGTIPKWVSEKDALKMLSKYEGNFTSTQVGAIAETARTFNENITKKEAARKLTKPVPSLSETLQFGFDSVNPINIKAPIPPDQTIAPKRVYSDEEKNMAFLESGRLSGVIPKGLSDKDALKFIAEKRLQLDPKTEDILSEAVVTSKEKRKEIATASHEEILNNAAFRTQELLSADIPTQNLYKQSREGKVADIINRIQSGLQGEVGNETVSEAEWKYLKEVAPKAEESLWKEINPNNSNKLSDVIAVYKDKEKAYKVTSANSRAKSILAALPQDWLDENGQISEASLLEKHKEFNDNYAQSLIALEEKYPMQYAMIKTADGMQDRPIGRGYVYAAEKEELDNRRAQVNNIIAEANGVMFVRQVDKKTGKQSSALLSPDAIGEKIFKVQSPDIYKVYVKGGKTDRGIKEEIKRLGINALYASNDKNAIELAYVDEKKLNETSLDLENDTYNRIGAEIYKQGSGWKYFGTLLRDVDEIDKIVEQLPYPNRKMWYGKLRAIEENQTFGTNIPMGGAINSVIYGFGKTAASTVNTLSGAVGFRTHSDIANDALAGQDNKYSVVGETKTAQKIKSQLEYKLSNKEQLTYSELQDLENAKNLLGTKTITSKFTDKGFELIGQVAFQGLVARGLGGLTTKAVGAVGLLSEEAAVVAGAGEFGTSISGATTIGEIGVSKSTLDTLANAYVAYASSLDQAKQEAVLLMPDSKVKQEIYANVVGLLNAATAHLFPEQKLFDPLKKELSATITNIVNDLSASKLSKEALSGYVKKALLASKAFGIAVIKNNQKESAEEVAGQIGTSIALAILAPDKFNNKEEFDKVLDTYVQTTVDGTLLSLFAGGKEYFSNVVGIPLLSKVGTDENVYNKVIQGINSQVSNKEISEAEGEEKKYIANTIRYIYKKSIPKVAELSPNLKERDIQKYAIVLANEYVVRKKIDTEKDPVIKAKLEAQVKDSEAKREAIIDEKLTTVNNYELVTVEEANKIAKAEADNGQIVITNADGTVTTTPTKTIDGVGTYEFDNKLYVEDKDGNIKLDDGTSVTDQKTIDKIKKEGIFNNQKNTQENATTQKQQQQQEGTAKDNLGQREGAVQGQQKDGKGKGEQRSTENKGADNSDSNQPSEEQKVAELRAAEQAELDTKIPNAEQYRVNGKVDRTKLTNDTDRKAFDEVYSKYDKLITPILEGAKPKTVFDSLPVGIKASEGQPTSKSHAPLFAAAKKSLSALNEIFHNLDIHFHENSDDFQKVLDVTAGGRKASTTDGNFAYIKDKDGNYTVRIDINLSNPNASVTTVIHEAIHPILLSEFGENPKYFEYLKNQVAKSVGFTKNIKLKKFIKAYSDIEQPEEYLVQLGAILKDKEKIEPNVFRRIAEAINKIVLRVTKGKFKPFENVKDSNETVRYFSSLVEAIRTGDLSKTKLRSQSQEAGRTGVGSKQSRGGLTATDMKSMTVADNGDLLFFHYGDIKGSKVDARKGTPKAYTTDKRVYTTNYYYTNESDREGMVSGKVNVVRVPADKVYSFNKDVLGLFDEAKKNSEAQSKGQAFSPNRQADFIAQLAAKNGFDMMVAKWGNGYRAESPKALPIDAALTKQMRTNGSLSTAAVDEKLNQDIYNAAASKANSNSEKYRSAFYGIKDITAKDIMENPILSRGIPKKLADKYNGGQVKSKQSRSSEDNAKNLDEYRRNIDSIDNKILSNISNPLAVENLVYDRNKQVLEIVNYKKENGIPIEDTSREKIIIEKVMKKASEMGANVNDAVDLFKKIIDVSKELQRDFLGIDSDNRASNTQGFFSDVVTGDKKYTPISSYKNIIPLTESELKFEKNYKKFLGFFDEHIATSIPTFRETQIKVGSAIVSMFSKKINIRNSELGEIAEKYKKDNGIDSTFSVESTNVNPYFFKKLAEFHKNEKDDRSNKAMAKSYRAFLDETKKQYQYLIDAGYKIEPWMKQGEPYGTSSSLVRKDVDDNKHLYYLRSRAATGSGNENESAENYMPFENSGITINGEDVLFNDLFRAVHDIFGHVLVNNSFSTQGEFNAYQTHSKMYSKEAQKALFLETVMYNAWYDANKNYAPRKIYDIPEEFISYANANPLVYDIGGSEGGFIKAISSVSNGNINTINLEPNAEMVSSFNNKPIEGSSIIPEAFYEGFDEYKKHTPNKKADIVHESMVFQFIDSKRNNYIQEVKDNYLKEGGLFLTEEKLIPINDKEWANNEKNKDDNHKSLYYKADQITKKQEQVLTGMLKNQTYYSNYKSLLEYNFKHVAEYWDAGNFRGFAASDSKSILDEFIKGVGGKIVSDFSSAEGQQIKSKQSLNTGDKVKIEGVSVTIPNEAQQDLLKQERTAKSYFDEKVRLMEPSPLSKEEIKSILNRDDIAILTGTNPDGNAVADNTNNLLNKKAEDWLKRNGYTYHQVTGKYGQTESSFLVEGMTGNVALEFAKIFKQDSVLQSEGLIYREGTIEKRIADGDAFGLDVTEPDADYVSAIKTNTGEVVGFQFGIDLGNKVQYEIKSKQSKVSDILNDTFNQEAKKTKIDKLDIKALARKVVDIVKSSKLYTQTDDIERENAIIDFLKSKGIIQKRVIEPRNKNIISVNEVTALKDQIRLEIKAANDGAKSIEDAVKKIGEIIKGLAKGKKISVTSAKALINKFSNMNTANKDSVNSVLDYAEKIFNDAEYADKVAQVRALNSAMKKAASNNAIPPDTRSIALSFSKINPEAVSDIDAHLEAAKKIKDALVGVKENGVKIRKAIDINAMAEYLKTAMTEQDTYDAKNPTTTRVVEPLDEEKALEYLTAEHDSLLQAVKALVPSAVLTDAEMAQLKNFLKLSIDDFETMKDKIAVVEALDNFVKNADMGKIPFLLNNQQVNANIKKGVDAIMPKLTSVSLMWFSEQKAKLRGWFDNKTWYRDSPKDFSKKLAYFMDKSIRRIDNLIGNFKNNDVFNNTFKSLASGYAKYLFKINSMDADVIFQKVLSSFNGDMYKAVQHCYKMTMYKLQLEYESNIGNREVIPAMMHLEKTLKDGNLTKKDKAELRKLIEEFSTTDATTGEVKIDTEKIWDSFNKVEQKAAETLADYYAKLTPYAKHVAVSLRGVPFNPRANYMMLNVINQQSSLSATPPSTSQLFTKGSTKAGTIIERDGTAHAVSLDPYNTFNAANRDVMMDYCLLNPIKTVEAIFKKLVEDTANDEKANDVAKSLEFIFNEITESIINRSFVMSDKVWTDVFNFIKKVGARYMLAKIDKAPAEFAGNAIFAGIAYTENILEGIKNNAYQRNFELSQAMEALDSYSIDRLYPHKGQSGAFLDPNSFDIDVRDKKHFIDGASNVAQVVYYNSLLQAQKGGEAVSDFLVTAPDLAVGRMAWEGTLRLEFKKETGTEIDLEKIIKKDYDYLEKYKDALEKATTEADRVIVDIASSKNPFVGMAKESVRRDYNSFMTSIDGFLRSFSKNENQVGMDAAYALIKSGKIDRARGTRLLAAILARGGVYNSVRAKVLLLLTGLGFAIVNGITGGDDSEEKRRRRARLQLEYMNVEGDDWAEKSPVVAGKKILYAGNIYEVVTGGITSSNPPSDTSGKIITDGTAKYKWVGTIPRIQGSITGIKDNVSMGNSLRTYDKQFIEKAKKAAAPEETMAHSFNKGAAQSAVGIILGRNSGAIFSNLFMAPAVEYANEKFIHPAISSDPYDKYRDGIMYSKMIDRSRKDPELNFIIDNTGVFNPFFKAAVTGYRMFDNKYGDRLRELNKKIEAHEKGVKVPREESSKEKYYGFIAERDALLEKQKPVKVMMAKNIIIAAFTVTGVLPSGKTIDVIADKTLQDKILSPSDMDDIIKKIEDARNYSGGGSVRLENAKENDKVLVYPDIYTDYTLQGRKIPAKKP